MGIVQYIVERMKNELMEMSDCKEEPKVIATGGMASMMAEGVDCIDEVDKMLTLEGLRLIYEKNKKSKNRQKEADPCELETLS